MKYMVCRRDPMGFLRVRDRSVGRKRLSYDRRLDIKLGMFRYSISSSWMLVNVKNSHMVHQPNSSGKSLILQSPDARTRNFLIKGDKPSTFKQVRGLGNQDLRSQEHDLMV